MTRPAKHKRSAARGFTLLEIMIVGVLTAVLMIGVWSLFRSWGRLYDRGERRVQAAQLVRSLCDQFSDDVRAVAQVASPSPRQGRRKGSGSRSRRRSNVGGNQALVGGSDWLVLEVLQPPNPYLLTDATTAAVDTTADDAMENAALYAPELQRVMYTFQMPAAELDSLSPQVEQLAALDDTESVDGGEETPEPLSGLVRMVVPVEQFEELMSGDDESSDGLGSTIGMSNRSTPLSDAAWQLREMMVGALPYDSAGGLTEGARGQVPATEDESSTNVIGLDEVPEVIWFEFRYFDGASWTNSWDSRSEGRLPVAVEMRFELQKEESEASEVSGDGETELVDDGLSQADTLDSYGSIGSELDSSVATAESYEETPYYRCVVYLEPKRSQETRRGERK